VGGLIIGVAMHKMTMGQAAKVYTLLSIGDGLVAQIPSLLIALTAGIVTTRVSSDRKDANLGKEISSQLLREPRAVILAAIAVLGIGFFKGFPLWSFALVALFLGTTGVALWRRKKKENIRAAAAGAQGTIETDIEGHALVKGGGEDFALTLPVILEVGKNISEMIKKGKGKGTLNLVEELIPKMRQALYQDLGIRFPGVHVRTDSPLLEHDEYVILLNEVPVTRGKIPEGRLLTNELEENLRRYSLPYMTYKNASGLPSLWVEERYKEIMEKAGIKYWSPLEVVILHLSYFFRQNGQEFLGIQEVRSMLEFMERSFPDLIKEVTRLVPLQKLTEIFRRLVQEQISIKDLRTTFE
ncbi:MAG: FHIPEP family type III secretion protein, partial [Chlamydiia bacterium]|nr:FHIPEP family type III secretion protein [Chlamydiia bacterium]